VKDRVSAFVQAVVLSLILFLLLSCDSATQYQNGHIDSNGLFEVSISDDLLYRGGIGGFSSIVDGSDQSIIPSIDNIFHSCADMRAAAPFPGITSIGIIDQILYGVFSLECRDSTVISFYFIYDLQTHEYQSANSSDAVTEMHTHGDAVPWNRMQSPEVFVKHMLHGD
jgi:hypothetical protein